MAKTIPMRLLLLPWVLFGWRRSLRVIFHSVAGFSISGLSIADYEPVTVAVGSEMVTGVDCETPSGWSTVGGGITFDQLLQGGFTPFEGQYIMNFKFTVFETDIPVQHMWSPKSGRHYKVLWTKTFSPLVGTLPTALRNEQNWIWSFNLVSLAIVSGLLVILWKINVNKSAPNPCV